MLALEAPDCERERRQLRLTPDKRLPEQTKIGAGPARQGFGAASAYISSMFSWLGHSTQGGAAIQLIREPTKTLRTHRERETVRT